MTDIDRLLQLYEKLQNMENIVNRLKESIKAIEDLEDKDTIYEVNNIRLALVLPYLKSILGDYQDDGKSDFVSVLEK